MEQEPLIQKEEKQSSRNREYTSSLYEEETLFRYEEEKTQLF
jgi:hypothetical protein